MLASISSTDSESEKLPVGNPIRFSADEIRSKEEYPALKQMGINNPGQIQSYSLSSGNRDKDILRIRYARPAGSLLPMTRSYEFDRVPRPADAKGLSGSLIEHEISHILNDALLELDSIVRRREGKSGLTQDILDHIEQVERELADLRDKALQLQRSD